MTNRERLAHMSDKELSGFLCKITSCAFCEAEDKCYLCEKYWRYRGMNPETEKDKYAEFIEKYRDDILKICAISV